MQKIYLNIKYIILLIFFLGLIESSFAQETLQSVTTNGNSTTTTITTNSGSVTPATAGNAAGNFNMFAGTGGPSLSFGIVNTGNSGTHWGWLQTAYSNSAQTFGFLSLNPLGGRVGIGTNNPGDVLTANGNIRVVPLYNSMGLVAYDATSGGNSIFSLTRQTNDLDISAFDGIGFSTVARSGPSINYNMYINTAGNIGIGTINPTAKLTLAGNSNPNPNTGSEIDYSGLNLTFKGENSGGNFNLGTIKMVQPTGYYTDHADMVFYTAPGGGTNTEKLRITGNGNVLIGKTTQKNTGYMLDVSGSARASAITVNADGADFVFEPTYKLNTLPSLKEYIEQNHHLPEIPSAKEMQKDGLNVGENQVKLLQKVEELTLYLIEKDEKEKEQQQKIDMQDTQLQSQQKEIDLLIKQVTKLSQKSK